MRIAYLSIGMSSTVHSGLELGRRLRDAGHEVIFISHVDLDEQIRAHGHDFVRLTDDQDFARRAAELPLSWSMLASPRRFAQTLLARRRLRQRSIESEELERTLERLAPNRLVIDLEFHTAILATARLGIPTWLAMIFFSVHRRPGLPPLHTTLLPSRSRLGRWRIELAWWRLRLETLHFHWRERWRRLRRCDLSLPVRSGTFDPEALGALARSKDFPLRRETSRREWLRPFMYRRLPVLCLNARELDFPHDPAPNVTYVGPMVQLDRAPTPSHKADLARWRAFLDKRQAEDGARPLVYASVGTFWSADRALLRRVLDVFARRPEWDLVLGLGGRLTAEALAPVPPNALVLDWAPQVEVLAQAGCALTHGGVTSLNECVRLGVPMVVYSTKFVEQNGNAARVAYHGLGVVADQDREGVQELEAHLEQALTDRAIRQRIGVLREHFLCYEEAASAVRLIETSNETGA